MALETPPLDAKMTDHRGRLVSPWFEYFEKITRYINNDISQYSDAALTASLDGAADATITATDKVPFIDVSASNSLKTDTVQGILDLVSASTPGLTLLSVQTASSSATIDFSNLLTNTYQDYLIVMSNVVPVTNGAILYCRVGTGATPTWVTTGNYNWSGFYTTGGYAGASGSSDTKIDLTCGNGVRNSGNEALGGKVFIYNPIGTTKSTTIEADTSAMKSGVNVFMRNITGGEYNQTTAVTSFRFYFSSGNISTGDFRLYGFNKTV